MRTMLKVNFVCTQPKKVSWSAYELLSEPSYYTHTSMCIQTYTIPMSTHNHLDMLTYLPIYIYAKPIHIHTLIDFLVVTLLRLIMST